MPGRPAALQTWRSATEPTERRQNSECRGARRPSRLGAAPRNRQRGGKTANAGAPGGPPDLAQRHGTDREEAKQRMPGRPAALQTWRSATEPTERRQNSECRGARRPSRLGAAPRNRQRGGKTANAGAPGGPPDLAQRHGTDREEAKQRMPGRPAALQTWRSATEPTERRQNSECRGARRPSRLGAAPRNRQRGGKTANAGAPGGPPDLAQRHGTDREEAKQRMPGRPAAVWPGRQCHRAGNRGAKTADWAQEPPIQACLLPPCKRERGGDSCFAAARPPYRAPSTSKTNSWTAKRRPWQPTGPSISLRSLETGHGRSKGPDGATGGVLSLILSPLPGRPVVSGGWRLPVSLLIRRLKKRGLK